MTILSTREDHPQLTRAQGQPALPATPQAAPQAGGGFSASDFLRILRKRWLMMLLFLFFFVGASVVGHFLLLRYAPTYTAEAYVEVSPPRDTLSGYGQNWVRGEVIERMLMNYAQIVKRPTVIDKAINDQRLRETGWFNSQPKQQITSALEEELSVSPVPDSSLLRISMSGHSPTELPNIINAVADAAADWSIADASGTLAEDTQSLRETRTSLDDQLGELQNERKELSAQAMLGDYEERRESLLLELRALIQQKRDYKKGMEDSKKRLQLAQEQQETGDLSNHPDVFESVERDPRLHALRTARMNLATELSNAERKLGPGHRTTQDLDSRLQSVTKQMQAVETEIVESRSRMIVESLKQEFEFWATQYRQLMDELNYVNAQLTDIQRKIERIDELDGEIEKYEERVSRIDQRLDELTTLERASKPMQVLQPATMPVEPSFPKLAIMIPLGVLLGLVSGIGLAVLLEFVDTSIRRPSDVAQKLDIPLLGIIPHADDVEDDFEDVRTALLTHRDSLMGETFRQIRTNLQFSGPTQQHKTLLITSASPEDGRTTVAVNLAVAVANAGSKVLLIDANFRQPAIAELFPQAPEGGLSSALVEQAHWQESVAEVEPNLHVMGAGPLPPNPAELLGSQRMAALLQEVGSQYDQVIIDGAPCLVVTDSVILSRSVDAVLLVLRAGVNTHGVASKVRGMLRTVDAHVVGAVLNSVRAMAGGYLRKNYDAYYDYQEAPKLPAR